MKLKTQKKLLKHILEFLVILFICFPLGIQIAKVFWKLKSPMFEYLQLASLSSAMIFFSIFYVLRYGTVLKQYRLSEKKQKLIIDKLKEEKETIEKGYINSIQMNKEMTSIVKRLIDTQRVLKQKNEWLRSFFELTTEILSLSDAYEVIKLLGSFESKSLGFLRISVYFNNQDNVFKHLCYFGKKDPDEELLLKKAREDVNIAYRMEQKDNLLKIAVPMISEDKCEGVCFFTIRCNFLEKEDISYYISVCNFITIAIKNSIYYSNLKKQKLEIEDLYEKSTYVNEKLKETIEELNKSKVELEKKNAEIERFFYEIILCLSKAIEYKDLYTKGHCERVQSIALKIADELGLSKDDKDVLKVACLLHDIGKIGIKEEILNKKEPLLPQEYEEIKRHPLIGYNILKDLDFMKRIQKVILQHHERVDGKGYPYGLKDDEIDLLARIISVADAYDAMTSDRPYRRAFTKDEALKELQRCAGSQFDKSIVEKLLSLAQKGMVMFL
ncbi:HD-GYP domain-containing protein [Caldicellulosiruptor naganoensis]|uniref:HD-GYP domain-containing protein n=1 Tax=Caldicellulosiruptor naganoensis TaxID=29324 RepID=A0ABY7BEF8_9FIRM|nr:HD-GYP domain-containing protein [Caldicellulosiruptor naganoensis]WAM31203.1 HD-GYP domain-containing protein [Caldicellulosiruptor naganoensis]